MLDGLDRSRDISLYIHIPFCTTKCGYCAFYSLPEAGCRKEDYDSFYRTISRQLEALVEELKQPFHTIFIGGGNPAMLGFERLASLLKLACRYGLSQECTTEINPEHVSPELEELLPYLTRVSVGLQSFSTPALKTLGRNATREANLKAMEELCSLREKHGLRINGDLITCIPSHPLSASLEDVDILSAFKPDHISLYSLTFEEGTALTASSTPLGEDREADILTAMWKKLEEKGYEQYEISNFARGGAYCRHNLVYWRLGQYIGLGPSAESSVGYSELVSSREKDTLDEYLMDPSFDSVRLTKAEAEEELLLSSLRTRWGIDKKEFRMRFAEDFDEKFSPFIESLEPELYINTPDSFSLTQKGFLLSDRVILSLAMAI